MIVLEGLPALSPFRHERLQARLQQLVPGLRLTGAWFAYFIEPEAGASPDTAALGRILLSFGVSLEAQALASLHRALAGRKYWLRAAKLVASVLSPPEDLA